MNGNLSPVLSPVYVRNGDKYEQKIIGYTPLLNSDEAFAVHSMLP